MLECLLFVISKLYVAASLDTQYTKSPNPTETFSAQCMDLTLEQYGIYKITEKVDVGIRNKRTADFRNELVDRMGL